MKNILITGGTGFLGSHCVAYLLLNTDWHLTVLDALTHLGDSTRLTEIPGYDPGRLKHLWHNLNEPIRDGLAQSIGPVDYLINLASDTDVGKSVSYPMDCITNNVALAVNVLEYARNVQPAKVIMVSSAEVYGPAAPGYASREWDAHSPCNPYAASKAAQEDMAVAWWRSYNVPVIITNTMNVFGQRQPPKRLIPTIVRNVLSGRPTQVYGEQTASGWVAGSRCWLHATNHADALLYILETVNPYHHPASVHPCKFHVVGEELSNLEVLQRVSEVMGVKPWPEWVDYHTLRAGHDGLCPGWKQAA